MKLILISLTTFLFSLNVFSQDTLLNKQLSAFLGLSDFHIRDEYASPLIYKNVTLTAGAEYHLRTQKNIHTFELRAYYGKLYIDLAKYDAENGRASFRYNYLHLISNFKIAKNKLSVYFGGGLITFLNMSKYNEYISNGVLEEPWLWIHSCEIALLTCYKFKPNKLTFQFNFSLISNVSRPSYSYLPGTHQNEAPKPFGKMAFFWQNPIIQVKTQYEFLVNRWLGLTARYDFLYSYYGEPRKIGMFMNNFQAGIIFLI